jgi:membrane-associated protein
MDTLRHWFHFITDVRGLVQAGGLIALAIIVFTETGLMFGFFLPGDSLLVTAGLFAAKGDLNIFSLIALLSVCAILGDATGYAIGKKLGPALFKREDSLLFKKKHLIATHDFYERHGGKTIIIARFVPIIRTFAPFVAGIGAMSYPRFITYNVVGAVLWVGLFVRGGYFFGNIPLVRKNFTLVILAIIAISVLPIVVEAMRARRRAA